MVRAALRLAQLVLGSALLGAGIGVVQRARLGVMPWDVLHNAISGWTGISFGAAIWVTTALVVLLCVPLRVRPNRRSVPGLLVGCVMPGLSANAALWVVPTPQDIVVRAGFLAAGLVIFAAGTACHIGSDWGPGPRDRLMQGLVRHGWGLRPARIGLDVGVTAMGWLAIGPVAAVTGGQVGAGTVIGAVVVGPLMALLLPLVSWRPRVLEEEPHTAGGTALDRSGAPS